MFQKQNRKYEMKSFFTLIELLVVIAILGILSSLLLPSLRKAKSKAEVAVCLSNMSQINTAVVNYTTHNDGSFPGDGAINWNLRWTELVDKYAGGSFEVGTHSRNEFRDYASEIWNNCPSVENDSRKSMYTEYGTMPQMYNQKIYKVDDTSNASLVTEMRKFRSIIMFRSETEYNDDTGFKNGNIRHITGFNSSFLDGNSVYLKWMLYPEFKKKFLSGWPDND